MCTLLAQCSLVSTEALCQQEGKNITDKRGVTIKGKLDEDHLTKIQLEKRPDRTIIENITIHDVKHAENLIKLAA